MNYKDTINERKRSDWEMLINEWVHNEIDRQLLRRRLLDGLSLNALCGELNDSGIIISVDQMKKRIHKAQNQLFKHI